MAICHLLADYLSSVGLLLVKSLLTDGQQIFWRSCSSILPSNECHVSTNSGNIERVRRECLVVPLIIFQLSFSMIRWCLDVNETPDKRQVFLQEERVLLATIKSPLRKIFDGGTASFDVSQEPLMQVKLSASTFVPRKAMVTLIEMKIFNALRESKMQRYQVYLL